MYDLKQIDWSPENNEIFSNFRTSGIGGSDAYGICVGNVYNSPLKVYLSKTDPTYKNARNNRMLWGTFAEDAVAKMFEAKTGKKVYSNKKTFIDKEYDFLYANIDRFVEGEDAILECKTASLDSRHFWDEGMTPESYMYQIQYYMGTLGISKAYIACVFGSCEDFVIREVDFNPELYKSIKEKCVYFWNNYVIPKKQPPAQVGDEKELVKIYETVEENKDLTPIKGIILNRIEAAKQEKEAKAAKDACDIKIKEFMEGCQTGTVDNYKVTNKISTRASFNSDGFKEDYPELAEQYKTVVNTSYYRVNTLKK